MISDDDASPDFEDGISPAFLLVSAVTVLLLGALLLGLALGSIRSGAGHSAGSQMLAATLQPAPSRPGTGGARSTYVYIVGSAEDASRLLRVLSEWTLPITVSVRAEADRQMVVVETAQDVSAGQMFDFAYLQNDAAGGLSVVDLRPQVR